MSLNVEKKKRRETVNNMAGAEFDKRTYFYALFCANIGRFLPQIDRSEYRNLFNETVYYQYCSLLEQNSRDYLHESNIINNSGIDFNALAQAKKTIVATFHLGSYRTIISYLYELGHKVVLIIDDGVFNSQIDNFKHTINNVLVGKPSSDLVILNVKERSSIVRLKSLVNEGYILTIYLDGNTGIKDEAQDFSKGYAEIDFLGQNICVKNGLGKLAFLLKAAIVPAISYRVEEKNTITFFPEIQLNHYPSKTDFIQDSIQSCYNILADKLVKYPAQWECWGYIHKWFLRNEHVPFHPSSEIVSKFNTDRYIFFVVNGSHFIFDLNDYKSHPISLELRSSIEHANFENINATLFNQLRTKNILV